MHVQLFVQPIRISSSHVCNKQCASYASSVPNNFPPILYDAMRHIEFDQYCNGDNFCHDAMRYRIFRLYCNGDENCHDTPRYGIFRI